MAVVACSPQPVSLRVNRAVEIQVQGIFAGDGGSNSGTRHTVNTTPNTHQFVERKRKNMNKSKKNWPVNVCALLSIEVDVE